jgi:hypothetical protein
LKEGLGRILAGHFNWTCFEYGNARLLGCKGPESLCEASRSRNLEVLPECCLTGPLLNEHEALWILGVLVHGVRDTPRFRSRTLHVFLTKRESFGDTTAVRDHASKHKNHLD